MHPRADGVRSVDPEEYTPYMVTAKVTAKHQWTLVWLSVNQSHCKTPMDPLFWFWARGHNVSF